MRFSIYLYQHDSDPNQRNGTKIKEFAKCDFRPLAEYLEAEKAKLKRMSKAEKQAAKEAREKLEAPFATCMFNGRPEKVGSFRIEPPGLFRGRGEHPKKGCVKVCTDDASRPRWLKMLPPDRHACDLRTL